MTKVDPLLTVMQETRLELAKEKPNLHVLLDLVHTIGLLFHQQFASDERKYHLEMLKEYVGQVQVVVDGHNHKGRTYALLFAGGISVACGVGGAIAVVSKLPQIQKAFELGAGIAQGGNTYSQLATDWRQAAQDKNQADLKMIEQKRDNVRQEISEHDRKVQSLLESASRTREARLQAFSEFSRA